MTDGFCGVFMAFFDSQDLDLDLPSRVQELDQDVPTPGQDLHKTDKSGMCYDHSSESVLITRLDIRFDQW